MGMVTRTCWCGKQFQAREADVKRGWAKACSKSHAAHAREKQLDRFDYRHGGRNPFHNRGTERAGPDDAVHDAGLDGLEAGWDGHKNAF